MMTLFRLGRPRAVASALLEVGLVFFAMYALAHAQVEWLREGDAPMNVMQLALGVSVAFVVALVAIRTKATAGLATLRRESVVFLVFSVIAGGLGALVYWLVAPSPEVSSVALLAEGAVVVPVVVGGWRWATVRLNVLNGYRERLLIIGTGESARSLCRSIAAHHDEEYAVVGFAAEDSSRIGDIVAVGARVQTTYESLTNYARLHADRVIVALDEKRGKLPIEPLMKLRLAGLEIEEATTFLERTGGKIAVESLLPSWLIFSDGFKQSRMRAFLKRTSDIIFAMIMLILALPLMLLTALLIKLESRGPALFIQKRVGLNGVEFSLLKFRSMVADAERKSGPAWASRNDPRVTRIGRFIRLVRIDELPQLVNVLRGEMSFVGPRPERKHFVQQLAQEIPFYELRLAVRPGLTGWAQVEYGYGATLEENKEKLRFDLFYIKNGNLLLDFWIVLKTIRVVLFAHGAR